MHNTACSNTSYPDGHSECGSLDRFVDELRIVHGFRHLDVVLAVEAGGSGPSRFSAGLAILDIEPSEFALPKIGEGLLQAADNALRMDCLLQWSRAPLVLSSGSF